MNIRMGETFICEEDYPVVSTSAGKIRGYVDDDVFCFKGMDYAYADRFHMPEPPKSWEGIKDAFDYGYGCPEMTYNMKGKKAGQALIQPAHYWEMDERVQNLNIWTKSIELSVQKPVMVWIHGGGFAGGAANHQFIYEGWALAHYHDVVVVSVNHRLNMLGYLDLSAFGEEYKNSGNLGMADLVAALKWVKENIRNFGGDPDNVTLFGQSGGGGKISTLLQMPAADGLYHKVIIQSGVLRKGKGPGASSSKQIGELTVKNLGLTRETIHQIETMEYDVLAGAVTKACETLGVNTFQCWAPVADGTYYIGDARDVGFRKETAQIPMIVGSCLAEFDPSPIGRKSKWTKEQKLTEIEKRFGTNANEIAEAFESAYPDIDVSYAACLDLMVRPSTLEYLNQRCKDTTTPVYNYIFAFENMVKGGQMSGHNGDLHFSFHNAFLTEGMRKEGVTNRLQNEMAGAWTQFAYTGSPNGSGLPYWKRYTETEKECMIFTDHSRLMKNQDERLLELTKETKLVDPLTGK